MECGGVGPDSETDAIGDGDDVDRLSVGEESGLQQEVELLQAIYIEDLMVDYNQSGQPESIQIQLHPATGDNVDQHFVCLTLEFNLPVDYPDTVPDMVIRNPRGLADDHVTDLRETLRETADQRAGMPMLYELIELVKESLTQSNVPHGQCVICLEFFAEGEPFTRTACYHYLHCGCLLRYVRHCQEEHSREREEIRQHKHMTLEKKQVLCPVCREPISYDLEGLQQQASQTPVTDAKIKLSAEVRRLQRQMAALFQKQQAKGGIIDVEAERNKFLIPSEDQFANSPPGGLMSEKEATPEVSPLTKPVQLHRGQGRGRATTATNKQTEPHWKDRRQHRDHRDRRGHGRDRRKEERVRTSRNQERRPERDGREQRTYNERNDQHAARDARNQVVEKESDSWQGHQGKTLQENRSAGADPSGRHGQERDRCERPKKVSGREQWKQEIHFVHCKDSDRRVANGGEQRSDCGLREYPEDCKPRGHGNRRDGGRWGGRGRGQRHSDHHRPRSGYEQDANHAKQLVPERDAKPGGGPPEGISHQMAPQACTSDPRKSGDNRRREPRHPRPPPGFRNEDKSSLHDSSANSHDSGEICDEKYYPPPPGFHRAPGPPPGFSTHKGQRSQPPPGFEERR